MADKQDEGSSDGGHSGIPPPTDQQKELANQAFQEFEKGQYSQCVNSMSRLASQRQMDLKVQHNKAVAVFYQSNQCAVDEFRNTLHNVCQMAKSNDDPVDGIEDVDNAVMYYNQAVLNYHTRQYHTALQVLSKGFQYIEPPDELLAQNVLLLWVELHLCVCQPEQGMGVLAYLEKSLSNGKGQGTPERGEQSKEGSDSNETLRAKISLYKTRCLAMMKSMKSCKREIKTLVNTPGLTGTAVQYLRAYFEYLRGNFRKAQKMLATAPGASGPVPVPGGESLAVMHHNNLGCIHMHLRKHHTAALFFRRAMQENDKAVKEVKATPKGKPMQTMGISKNCELLYNMGVQLLHCGKPSPAFECLIQAVQMYQVNPRLWLRLAECCIMANRENNDDDSKLEKRQQVIQGSVGSGYHRKLILGPGVGQDKTSTNAPSMPALSLEFAAMCLRNALLLLPDDPLGAETTVTDDSDGSKPTPEPVLLPAPPSSPMRAHEVANLRCSILAASSYVALCLNDHQVALQHAENLLRQPRLSGAQRYIGSMYMAEALVELDRIADAIGHLNPDSLTQADISTVPPEAKSDPGALCPWIPRELPKAKAMMQHNLAVAHAIRGEFDKANKYLGEGSKNNGTPLPAQMYYLKLYLDLMEGRRQMAQMIIKDHFGHVTPNRFQP
ncbi:hypothetical protein BaRGS_00010713 [Batillaria attramentaria]|uniref:CCR4-NOT transcription complex subunit 10 n=1 Tax=Batillaria attramentaria TaxID=370345 RepID=A0ABD0LFB5_9CAEN